MSLTETDPININRFKINPANEIVVRAAQMISDMRKNHPNRFIVAGDNYGKEISSEPNDPEIWAIKMFDSANKAVNDISNSVMEGNKVENVFIGHFVLENDFHVETLKVFLDKFGYEKHFSDDGTIDFGKLENDTIITVGNASLTMQVFKSPATETDEVGKNFAVSFFAQA